MARFHATWWDHPRLPSLDWIPMGDDPVNQSAEQAYNDCFDNFLRNFGERLSPRALQIAERIKDRIIALERALASSPLTIAHGDLRYDNLYFSEEGEMAVADWQIVVRARGPYDVAYFMSQSVEPAQRRANEMDILRSYHETLLEHGVKGYSFDQCFSDYRTCAMFCLVYPVISGGTLDLANERGTALVTAMLDRSLATILDLDCDEMIPA
jgi:thiamine kinase-like enzyme